MRKNLPVTQKEVNYSDQQRIVSTTDLKGVIRHVNADFIDISGFTKEELIGQAHNIVRHPDMPQAAYVDLWQTIQAGKPWMGMVKNRCKNGDHYWVNALVTPVMEQGKLSGYQSVRLKPNRVLVERAERLYSCLQQGRRLPFSTCATRLLRLRGKIFLFNVASVLTAGLLIPMLASGLPQILAFTALLATAFAGGHFISRPWRRAARQTEGLINNSLARLLYTGRDDELGQLELVQQLEEALQETIVWRINDATGGLENAANRAAASALQTEQDMQQQKQDLTLIAAAVEQMSATVHEVAKNTSRTAQATLSAQNDVESGEQVVSHTVAEINRLAEQVGRASEAIGQLAKDSQQIGSVVDVIQAIAEQTNLLALNAAIEAARAGEQGRGFAVVADEVRTLAGRTQNSTEEIRQTISKLQQAASEALTVMERGHQQAQSSVTRAQEAGSALSGITHSVDTITDMSNQIATAAEQQHATTEEINRSMLNIDHSAEGTLQAAKESLEANQHLLKEIQRLQMLVRQFSHSHHDAGIV